MSCSIVINPSASKLQVNKGSYDLDRISDVQVKVISWKDKILNMVMLGAIASSILFVFIPTEEQGQAMTLFLPAVAFLVGACMALVMSTKYEFRLEFRYSDGVGVQWFTAAKGRTAGDYQMFKERELELRRYIR